MPPRRTRLKDEDEETTAHNIFRAELWACVRVGGPLALANLLERLSLWFQFSLVGHHGGAAELGPASLASSVTNVFGTSVNIGLALAVQTLASQAAGVGDAMALNRVLQRALPVSVVFSIPVVTLLLCLGPLLRALGRPEAFASAAHQFALTILPVGALTGAQRSMTAWLAALQITRPTLVINLVLVPLHAVACWLLVYHTPLGYLGAGWATTGQMVLRCALMYTYISTSPKCRHAWGGFAPREAFSGWRSYLAIALPGVLFLAEFWGA